MNNVATSKPADFRADLSVLWDIIRGRAARPFRPAPGTSARPVVDLRKLRQRVIGELVAGKTFAEVGGLWGTVNETVSVAMRSGAREATMIDLVESGDTLWARFDERCRELGVTGYHSVVGDICNDHLADDVGRFDITYCAGVVYHVPNPVDAIRNLIAITRERFILTSSVVPARIANRAGTLALAPGQCLLVPTLDSVQRDILREYFTTIGRKAKGITREGTFVRADGRFHGGPWWWLFTADTLIRMCELFNISVERTWHSKPGTPAAMEPTAVTVLARVNA